MLFYFPECLIYKWDFLLKKRRLNTGNWQPETENCRLFTGNRQLETDNCFFMPYVLCSCDLGLLSGNRQLATGNLFYFSINIYQARNGYKVKRKKSVMG
jgi:hypothetical protein